ELGFRQTASGGAFQLNVELDARISAFVSSWGDGTERHVNPVVVLRLTHGEARKGRDGSDISTTQGFLAVLFRQHGPRSSVTRPLPFGGRQPFTTFSPLQAYQGPTIDCNRSHCPAESSLKRAGDGVESLLLSSGRGHQTSSIQASRRAENEAP